MASWVYILECADGSFYTGCTTNLEQRIAQHKAGTIPGYTSTRRPVECVYVAEFQRLYDAIDWERRIKRWSRVKKAALIAADYDRLPTWRGTTSIMDGRSCETLRPSTRPLRGLLRMTKGCEAANVSSL